jgi:hypothetical protein
LEGGAREGRREYEEARPEVREDGEDESWEVRAERALKKLREATWEIRKERALERIRKKNESSDDTVDPNWEDSVSCARERSRESIQTELDCREETSEVDPGAEDITRETVEFKKPVSDNTDEAHEDYHQDRCVKIGVEDAEGELPLSRREEAAKDSDEVGNETPRIGRIDSKKEMDDELEYNPELRFNSSFEREYQDAVGYFESNGERMGDRPTFVATLENLRLRRLYETVHGGPPDVRIEGMSDVDRLSHRHPDIRKWTHFADEYRYCRMYFEIRNNQTQTQEQLAAEYDISQSTVSNIQRGIESRLIKSLRIREEERVINDWAKHQTLSSIKQHKAVVDMHATEEKSESRSKVEWIEPRLVREQFDSIRELEQTGVKALADPIATMIRESQNTGSKVWIADLGRAEIDKVQLSKIETSLQNKENDLQGRLREIFEKGGIQDLRLGLIQNRLYIWTPSSDHSNLLRTYGQQFYYYRDKSEIYESLTELSVHLGIQGSAYESVRELNDLLSQLELRKVRQGGGVTTPINIRTGRIKGESLHFQLDTLDKSLRELEGKIEKITGPRGVGGIKNPRFPEGEKLEEVRARFIATAVSDCHVRSDGAVDYYEENIERLERFIEQTLKQFGDFTNRPTYVRRLSLYRLKIQNPYGYALNEWGIPSGDRSIQNYGLPKEVEKWSTNSIRAYAEDLIAEEGFVSSGSASWTRSNVMRAGEKKRDKYEFESRVTQSEIELIYDKGATHPGDFEGERSLSWNEVKQLRNSDDSRNADAAQKLHNSVEANRNILIDDERKLIKRLGIRVSVDPLEVAYYSETGRLSVKWRAKTADGESTIRWALLCPPNHPEKRDALDEWLLKQDKSDVRRIRDDLKKEGFQV